MTTLLQQQTKAGVQPMLHSPGHCCPSSFGRGVLTRQEEQDVTLRLTQVDLHHRDHRCIHVVRLRRLQQQQYSSTCQYAHLPAYLPACLAVCHGLC